MNVCKVGGCGERVHGKGYCHRHWQQLYRGGKVLDRTRYDKPNIRKEGGIAYITLYDKRENPVNEAIIDAENVEKVSEYKWHFNSRGYVFSKKAGLLHRLILGATRSQIVDHINRDKLDNRKVNLRIATRSVNVHNSKIPVTNTSGVKGVYYHKATGGWEAFYGKDGKRIRKLFRNKEGAIEFRRGLESGS